MSIFDFRYFLSQKIRKYQIENSELFFPFDRILKHSLYFYFNSVNNSDKKETERQCYFSDDVAVCGMGLCVIRPFNFRLKSKIEN